MSSAERRATTLRGGEWVLAVAILAALVAALLPVLGVVEPGAWLLGAVVLAALVLTAGFIARSFHLPAVAVSLIEAGVWVGFMSIVFFRDSALLWLIPTPETVREVPDLYQAGVDEIVLGAAPLEPTVSLSFFIVGAMGLLAIIIDHVVVTARMPLLASIGIVAVSLIPAIAVPTDVDVMAFIFLAASILFLIRVETRSREKPLERDAERSAGVPATAVGIGAIAVVIAVVATPLFPQPVLRAGSGIGAAHGIDATLQLGDDLRRPQEVEVLLVRSDAPTSPYLRATTLSRFEGGDWEPDRVRTVPLEADYGLGPLPLDPDVRVSEYTTSVEVLNLNSTYLPVPYPAVEVTGLDGRWGAVPYNRTVMSQAGSTQGQTYEVVSNLPRPTLEQIRAMDAVAADARDETTELPPDLPANVTELALEVTAGTTNDYDALVLLQRWFRGGEFRYSLEAPVEDGFDGSGAEAVGQFLERKEGYCVHFASAFALMARTLEMPSRIVVGYLPGTANGEIVDSQPVFTVNSSLVHAWPEVYFEGIGWIPFEPTAGLGNPTSFSPAAALPGQAGDPQSPTPGATPTPTSTPGANPNDLLNPRDDEASGPAVGATNPLPMAGVVIGILFLLALPAVWREVRRRQLLSAAAGGDAASAWTMVQDAAIDVGIAVPASESPRAFAARLVDEGAPADAVAVLLTAIERASYAPSAGGRDFWLGDAAGDAATTVRAALLAAAPPSRRVLAVIAPRSLIVRPGSVYAGGTAAKAPTRSG
jgi:transglutaminase-like putative cysteine protease